MITFGLAVAFPSGILGVILTTIWERFFPIEWEEMRRGLILSIVTVLAFILTIGGALIALIGAVYSLFKYITHQAF